MSWATPTTSASTTTTWDCHSAAPPRWSRADDEARHSGSRAAEAGRLRAAAPVAPNETEDGRAKNRRVRVGQAVAADANFVGGCTNWRDCAGSQLIRASYQRAELLLKSVTPASPEPYSALSEVSPDTSRNSRNNETYQRILVHSVGIMYSLRGRMPTAFTIGFSLIVCTSMWMGTGAAEAATCTWNGPNSGAWSNDNYGCRSGQSIPAMISSSRRTPASRASMIFPPRSRSAASRSRRPTSSAAASVTLSTGIVATAGTPSVNLTILLGADQTWTTDGSQVAVGVG